MDLSTDILVLSIPVALLWRVHINLRQKIGLSLVLCLSLVMAMATITRMAGVRLSGGAVDIIWLIFWEQQECSIAVLMFSVSAFRPLFVSNSSQKQPPHRPRTSSYWRRRVLQKHVASDEESTGNGLPEIPSATMTGMRTMINARLSAFWQNEGNVSETHCPIKVSAEDVFGQRSVETTICGSHHSRDQYDPIGVAC